MESTEEQTRMSSSQGEEDEGSGVSGETLEGLASCYDGSERMDACRVVKEGSEHQRHIG